MTSTACCDQYADENGKHQWPFTVKEKGTAKLKKKGWGEILDKNYLVCYGEIYDDSKGRFRDGKDIRTSEVIKYDKEAGIIETRNTIYRLI